MTANRSDLFLKFILTSVILMVVGVYFSFFSYLGESYSPYYSDEFFYFKNSESFTINGSVRAAFTHSGNGSKLLGVDVHGPAYPILYGLISKVIGWKNLNILIINFLIFLTSILILFFSGKESVKIRTSKVLLVIGSPISLFYAVTFMPELIHIAGGILMFVACKKYLSTFSKADLAVLISLIFLLGIIRNTWFFALFGLMLLPGPLVGLRKSLYGILALLLPFLFQYFFHEQVPNTFSNLGKMVADRQLFEAIELISTNIKKNIYHAFYYTEGLFYTIQKVWCGLTILFAFLYFRQQKLIQFGLLTFAVLFIFNMVLYKNYGWIDLRLYTASILFLNLSMISEEKHMTPTSILLAVNFISFILILPFLYSIIHLRIAPEFKPIPQTLVFQITDLEEPIIIKLDFAMLDEFNLSELPIRSKRNQLIRYILPFYDTPVTNSTYKIKLIEGQLRAYPKNNR